MNLQAWTPERAPKIAGTAARALPPLAAMNRRHLASVFGAALGAATIAAATRAAEPSRSSPVQSKIALCSSCHGKNGLPSDHTVPIIRGQQRAYLRKQLIDYRNGDRSSEIMSSIAESLSEREIAQIADYIGGAKWPERSTASPPAAPAEIAPVGIATCKTCHNANLTGGMSPAGASPRLAGQLPPYLVAAMTAYADGERGNSSQMSALMQSLSATDRQAIADYLGALR
jgi:cytochrome c553